MAIIPLVWVIACAFKRSFKSEEDLFCRYAMYKHSLQFGKGARSEVLVSISVDGHQGEASSYGVVCCVVLI